MEDKIRVGELPGLAGGGGSGGDWGEGGIGVRAEILLGWDWGEGWDPAGMGLGEGWDPAGSRTSRMSCSQSQAGPQGGESCLHSTLSQLRNLPNSRSQGPWQR